MSADIKDIKASGEGLALAPSVPTGGVFDEKTPYHFDDHHEAGTSLDHAVET